MKEDYRNYRRKFCSCEKKAWKISYNSSPRSSRIWFSNIQNFIIILSRANNEPIQRLAPSWFVCSIGRALHRYRRSQGFESSANLIFFRLSFRDCKSCVYNINCDDLLSYKKYCNRPFPSSSGPLYLDEVKCSAFDMEMTFHFHAYKTHFHKKCWALGLILKVRVFMNKEILTYKIEIQGR